MSGTGFDALIANSFSKLKNRGFSSYIKLVLKNVIAYKPQKYSIEIDNEKLNTEAFFIAFANASEYGNGAVISPKSKINDGLLDIVIVKKFNKILIPKLIYYIFKKRVHKFKKVINKRGKKKRITHKSKESSTLKKNSENIISVASSAALKIHKTTAIIYCCDGYEGLAIRFRQQLNENSKMLCWHAVIPEMNHNEILGWRTNTDDLSVIFLQNDDDFYRNKLRVSINKKIIQKYNPKIIEINSFGNSKLEKTLYLVHLTDWISWFLSELNNVDSIEIDVINYLKSELSKIN